MLFCGLSEKMPFGEKISFSILVKNTIFWFWRKMLFYGFGEKILFCGLVENAILWSIRKMLFFDFNEKCYFTVLLKTTIFFNFCRKILFCYFGRKCYLVILVIRKQTCALPCRKVKFIKLILLISS